MTRDRDLKARVRNLPAVGRLYYERFANRFFQGFGNGGEDDPTAVDGKAGWPSFWQHFESGDYERDTYELLRSILRPGDLFVDIGAWIGPVSVWATRLGAQVIAVEPDPVARQELSRQVPTAEVWPVAVVAEGPTEIELAPNPNGDFGDSMSRIGANGVRVPGRTLWDVLGDRVPALVTIDVEGYEDVLLPSIVPRLAKLGVPLQVELHNSVPDPNLFKGYRDIQLPDAPRNGDGQPNRLRALP